MRNHDERVARREALRAVIAEKFPRQPLPPVARLPTGCELLDREQGGLRKGAITELCASAAGGLLFFGKLLEAAEREGFHAGLIDAANTFDPGDWTDRELSRIFWVMAGGAETALKAIDLLLRDGNLPLLVCDLHGLARGELQRIPPGIWHRFQRLIEQTSTVLLVLSPQPLVQGAAARIAVANRWGIEALSRPRAELPLDLRVFERGAAAFDGARKFDGALGENAPPETQLFGAA